MTSCHAERRVGDRFSPADRTSGRRLEPVPFPEHEPAHSALGRNLFQTPPLGVKTFPKVLQVILDFFFRPVDGGGDLPGCVRPLLQEGADLTPRGFRFLQLSDYGSGIHPLFHPPSEIAFLPGEIWERPAGIEKIIHERRRDDADRLNIYPQRPLVADGTVPLCRKDNKEGGESFGPRN